MRPIADAPALVAHDPQWVVFWAGHVRPGQFAIWEPYLRHTRARTIILCSGDRIDEAVLTAVEPMPRCAVARPFPAMVDALHQVPGLRGFLYVGSYHQNAELIDAFPEATHVWIGHGESAKKANAHRTATVYDAVFVADRGAVRRYRRAARGWIGAGACAIGTPVVEGLVADPWTSPRPVRSILYAPTWEGSSDRTDYGSLPLVVPDLLAAMPSLTGRGVEVILRPHPSSGHRIAGRADLVAALLAAGAVLEPDKAAAMTRADVLIGDVSGLTSEFLFTRKPILLPVDRRLDGVIAPAVRQREYAFAYPWDVAREPLLDRIAALERSDPLAGARAAAARRAFRGHRTVAEAVATFDLALEAARGRGRWLSVHRAFELRRRFRWAR